jgi:hypothetical protein
VSSQTQEINAETAMLAALRSGMAGYRPVFRGQQLAEECGDHNVSMANVEIMRKAGLVVRDLIVFGDGENLLVSFTTGEQYWAKGFAYGDLCNVGDEEENESVQLVRAKVGALARSAAKWLKSGDADDWLHWLTLMPAKDYARAPGRLELPHEKLNHDGNDDYAPDQWQVVG